MGGTSAERDGIAATPSTPITRRGGVGPGSRDSVAQASVADQDAYALSGQKCSAQSLLFIHKNWADAKFILVTAREHGEMRQIKKNANLETEPNQVVAKRPGNYAEHLMARMEVF